MRNLALSAIKEASAAVHISVCKGDEATPVNVGITTCLVKMGILPQKGTSLGHNTDRLTVGENIIAKDYWK